MLPMMPFAMHTFDDNIICGKRGGNSFVNATRPDYNTKKCPTGTAPCSNFTSLENTICYDTSMSRNSSCPITGFEFTSVKKSNMTNAVTMDFVSNKSWFSFSRDVDALPATKLKVEAESCMDADVQINAVAFPTEL